MRDQERYEALRRGLVGPNVQLYRESADFRYVVEQMSQWLPEIADLLADGARWRQERFAERLHERRTQMPAMVVTQEALDSIREAAVERDTETET